MHRLLLTFYLQTIIIYVYCYNIEQNPRSIKYLLSPSQQRLLKEQTPSVSGRVWHSDDKDGGPLPSELPSSFFGYDFNLAKSDKDNNFRAVVGAPKSKDESFTEARSDMPSTPAKGNILNCPIENIFTNNAPPVCPSIAPPGTKPGDDIGLSVAVDPRGQVSACSPTRLQDCDVVQYTPGYCYQQSRGAWKEDPTNNNKNCHSYTLDLMFVLDGSFSIGRENFEAVKSWVKNVSEKFDISDGSTQIGVIQYSAIIKKLPLDKQKYIKTEVRLGEFTEKEQLFRAVDNIELQGYTTHTASALNKSAFDFLASNRYKNASKVLILLTDGQANDKKQLPYSADYVRSLNINTFAVGVGKIKVSELKIIATGTNSTKNVFFLKNFDQLAQIVNQLRSAILTFVLEGSNNRSTAAFKLQNAETGFSIRPSVALNRRGRPVSIYSYFNK